MTSEVPGPVLSIIGGVFGRGYRKHVADGLADLAPSEVSGRMPECLNARVGSGSAAPRHDVRRSRRGSAAPRPETPGMRDVTRVVDRIGLLQIDSVNVLTRAHNLRCSPVSGLTTSTCWIGRPASRRDAWSSTGRTSRA